MLNTNPVAATTCVVSCVENLSSTYGILSHITISWEWFVQRDRESVIRTYPLSTDWSSFRLSRPINFTKIRLNSHCENWAACRLFFFFLWGKQEIVEDKGYFPQYSISYLFLFSTLQGMFYLSHVEVTTNWNAWASNKPKASVLAPGRRSQDREHHSILRPADSQQTQCFDSDVLPQSGVNGTCCDSLQVPTKWRCLLKWLFC